MPVALLVDCEEPGCPRWCEPEHLASCAASVDCDLSFACDAASDLYRRLSGLQFCERSDTIRPYACNPSCGCSRWSGVYYRHEWAHWAPTACSCSGGTEVDLRELGPISALGAVTVDGVPLDVGAYALFDDRRLVRLDGGTWACCQDLSIANGDEGSWSVDVTHGESVTAMGKAAAIEMACEIAKALTGSSDCSLPRRVQNVARQGVSVSFVDTAVAFRGGMVGLPLGDLFLSSLDGAAKARRGGTVRRLGAARSVRQP